MTISKDLLMSILSMDSYNQGYGRGLVHGQTQIGTATLLGAADGLPTDSSLATAWTNAGFYAAAYNTQYGTVISYRGTDNPGLSTTSAGVSDILHGWITGIGVPNSSASLALQFYNGVTQSNYQSGPASSTILTGHSLGGGLAGFVSALSGTQAVIYDHMPFGLVALAQYAYDHTLGATTANWTDFLHFSQITGESVSNEILQSARDGTFQLILGGLLSYVPYLGTYFAALGLTTAASSIVTEAMIGHGAPLNSHSDYSSLSDRALKLHMMDLFVQLQFAKEQNLTEWQSIGPELWDAYFSDTVAAAAGAGSFSGNAGLAGKMGRAIAYSAIDEGTRVFGDVGIRAMFNDADDLGRVVSMADASTTILDAKGALAEILVQFAGKMAFAKVLMASAPNADKGVLSVSADQSVLAVDFSDALWGIGGGSGSDNIIGRQTLTDQVIGTAGPLGFADTRTGMQWLWGDDNSSVIDRIAMATTNAGTVFTIPDRAVASPDKATIFAAGGGNDTITGSKDNDFIVGGDGNDIIRGMAGDDLQLLAAA